MPNRGIQLASLRSNTLANPRESPDRDRLRVADQRDCRTRRAPPSSSLHTTKEDAVATREEGVTTTEMLRTPKQTDHPPAPILKTRSPSRITTKQDAYATTPYRLTTSPSRPATKEDGHTGTH
jgi:hypothetical protein